MQLDSRQIKILQEMGIPMAGFALQNNSSIHLREKQLEISLPDTSTGARQITSPSASNPKLTTPGGAQRDSKQNQDKLPQQIYTPTNTSLINSLDWLALQETVSTCQACALSTSRQRVVWGSQIEVHNNKPISKPLELKEGLDWLVIDHCPTDLEDQTGNPLSSDSGLLLFNMLKALCVHEQPSNPVVRSVNIINAVKCHPPGGRNPDGFETNQCKSYLQRQVELLKPRAILILGLPTYKAIFLDHSISQSTDSLVNAVQDLKTPPLTQLRNEVLHLYGVPTFITYHPGSLLLHPQDKSKSWQDLSRAQAYLLAQEQSKQKLS